MNRAFGRTATYVLRFLDAYLKHDAAAKAYLARPPAQNGIPAYAATMDVREAKRPLPGRAAVAAELARGGAAHALEAYRAMRAREPAFELKEGDLNEWGYGLLAADEPRRAVDAFRLATALYPDSANAWDSLAEGCERAGDLPGAIDHYRRSLALDAGNDNARRRLGELGAKTASSE